MFELSQKDESRVHSAGTSKACSKSKSFDYCFHYQGRNGQKFTEKIYSKQWQ